MIAFNRRKFKKLYDRELLSILNSNTKFFVKLDRGIYNEALTLRWLLNNKDFVFKELIKQISKNSIKPIAIEKNVFVGDKYRKMYFFDWHIRILHGIMAKLLMEELENILPDVVVSYRKGYNIYDTVQDLADYTKSLSLSKHELKKYLRRKDIKSYGDNVNHKVACEMLNKYLSLDLQFYSLLCNNIRFFYYQDGGKVLLQKEIGLPTGSPLNNIVLNLYMLDFDLDVQKLDGFYRRYGDDIIFIGKDVEKFDTLLDEYRRKLFLTFNEQKDGWILVENKFLKHFSKQMVKYLGFMLDSNGRIFPSIDKDFKIRKELIDVIKISYLSMRKDIKDPREQIKIITNSLRVALDTSLLQSDIFNIIGTVSEEYFSRLDFWLAKTILKFVLGKSSNTVFKQISMMELRRLGLFSFKHARRLLLYRKHLLKDYLSVAKT